VYMREQGDTAMLLPGAAGAHAQCFSAWRAVMLGTVTQGYCRPTVQAGTGKV
jgi:hypothetical protein